MMYLLSDFFIATPDEKAARDRARSPVLTLPTVVGRGVDCEKYLWLSAIVCGAFQHPQISTLIQEIMRAPLPHYPSDMDVAPELVEGLAGLCDEHRQRCAAQWALLEGWDAHGVTAEHAGAMFLDVADLAQQAVESGRGMCLWQCEYP